MGRQEAEQLAIITAVKDLWNETELGPIKYPNDDVVMAPTAQRTSVEISHPAEGRQKMSIGSSARIHSLGFLTFVCHLPLGKGKLQAVRISDTLTEFFDELHLYTSLGDLIVFRTGSPTELGEKDGSYRTAIVIPFRRQEIH